jgi:DNA repair exonuclease SbcCD nuclease subunit
MINVIAIGDTHFKVSNISEVDLFISQITKLIEEKQPDFIVLLGDTLDTHERIHTIPLNKAYEFIDKIRKISKVFILVGNHDMINGTQYLTTNHWLNGLKEWNNVVIVDKPFEILIKDSKFIFCPFVYPGRFEEALNTLENDWKDAICIFAHQEFYGCKMGAIISVEGDKWSLEYPDVISGHIHNNQKPQENIYYPGSSLSFEQNQNVIIPCIKFESQKYEVEEIKLDLPSKIIVYKTIEDVEEYKIPDTKDKLTVSISGDYNEFKEFKKTSQKYKELIKKGIKIVYKAKRIETKLKNENLSKVIENNTQDLNNFKKILDEIIEEQNDPYLYQVYEIIVNNKITNTDDIIFV